MPLRKLTGSCITNMLACAGISITLFVFRNRRRQMLRILFYDGGGFFLTAITIELDANRRVVPGPSHLPER
jgi:hypothetical protein